MKIKKITALLLIIAILFSTVTLVISANVNNDVTSTDSFFNHERQLFTFEVADYSSGTYTIRNITTQNYICYSESGAVSFTKNNNLTEWKLMKETDGYMLVTSDNRCLTINDVNSNAVFKLAELASTDKSVATFSLENANGEKREFVPGGTFAIKFNKKISDKSQYIYDNGEAVYTISKYADSLMSANAENWHIQYKKTVDGIKYYTVLNVFSGKYLYDNPNSPDNSPLELTSNYNDDSILWEIEEVFYSDIPEECNLPNEYVHYYQLTSINGNVLSFDSKDRQFVTKANVGKTPSNLLVFDEGTLFNENPYANIKVLGGDSTETDLYDPANTTYLKVVKDGNEYIFSTPWKNSMDSQKWEIVYVEKEEASDNDKQFGTEYFYYTVKNIGLEKYLTIKDGILTMDEYIGDDTQLWCLYDVGIRFQSEEFDNHYTLVNKAYKWSIGIDKDNGKGFYYDGNRSTTYAHGAYGSCWELFDAQTEGIVNLNHSDPENIVKNAIVTMRARSSSNYFQVVGPDIDSENALATVYVSANGNDDNDGRTKETPIKTIEKLNSMIAENGIRKRGKILFERGSTFKGELIINDINGRLYREITFGSYGNTNADNPQIISDKASALNLSNSTYINFEGIDFKLSKTDDYFTEKEVISINNCIQIKFSNFNVSGAIHNNHIGFSINSSGNEADTTMQSIWIDNINFKDLNMGVVANQMDGATISDSSFKNIKSEAITLDECKQIYIYNNIYENCSSIEDTSVISVYDSIVTVDSSIIKNSEGNAIVVKSDADTSNTVKITESVINNIGKNAIRFENVQKNEGISIDSIIIDDTNLLNWGIKEKSAALSLANPTAENSFSIYLINSTMVKSAEQQQNCDYYNFNNTSLCVVYELDDSFVDLDAYNLKLNELNKAITTARLLPRGNTDILNWETFISYIESAQSVYESYYPTIFDINSVLESLKTAADLLDNGDEPQIPEIPQEPENENVAQEITGVTIEGLSNLIETTDGDINLRASEPFILTVEMQKLFIESGKKLTVTLVDNNDVVYLQWIFPVFTAECDINLGLNDLSENEAAQALMKKGRVISLTHREALPIGTKIIVQNGFFEKGNSLKLYYQENGKFNVISKENGEEKVLLSNDGGYLQLTINRGGDFLVKENALNNNYNDTDNNFNTLWLWVIIGGSILLLSVVGIIVFIVVKRKKN